MRAEKTSNTASMRMLIYKTLFPVSWFIYTIYFTCLLIYKKKEIQKTKPRFMTDRAGEGGGMGVRVSSWSFQHFFYTMRKSVPLCISMFNPYKPNGFSHSYYLEESILHFRGVRLIFFFISLS